ncbi:HD-GYP domain-containing protein [Cohnella algarum]|uniref:HD-GYP domain-containing protein n=1 Tax=Cohnella algarum TaxID=2044859 RepID=UPI0019684E7C|nr:HD-GYP domain-containing protein [Cohnella algarum]MBN2981194.1 HD-GYP domain-containing protein [Cohnella algarum]
MPVLPVAQVQEGDCLTSDVITSLGSLLLPEGRILSDRDLEILQAFLIPNVEVRRNGLIETTEKSEENVPESEVQPLQQKFLEMEKLLKHSFDRTGPGDKLPVLELRKSLLELIDRIEEYNVLTFVPVQDGSPVERWIRNSVLCALTSYKLAKWCKLPEKDWTQIALAGLLHDIGNVRIDPAIFHKPTRLTPAEIQEMRQHTVYGFRLLEGVPSLSQGVALAALQHHERLDGSGYPMKLSGDKIHQYAKIVAIADMYHAMTTTRNERKGQSPYLVLEELQSESFGKLDPLFVRTFIDRATHFHNGMLVQLNDNRVGEIVFTDVQNPTRPMISIYGEIVNLSKQRDLYICAIYSA